jgi:leader peptidase (prepilin peptidase)/N-methyltransferase
MRYPLVETAVALLWTLSWLRFSKPFFTPDFANSEIPHLFAHTLIELVGYAILCWLLVALAMLDAEHFWLPDWLTLPGIGSGFLFTLLATWSNWYFDQPANVFHAAWRSALAILASAGLILAIRLAYWLLRRQEGIGLGDVKLMAMLGAWLGLRGALETFMLAVLAASAAAILWLAILAIRRNSSGWSQMPLPLGTFLCIAGLVEVFYPHWLLNPARLGF